MSRLERNKDYETGSNSASKKKERLVREIISDGNNGYGRGKRKATKATRATVSFEYKKKDKQELEMTEVSQDPKKSVRKSKSEHASVYAQKVRNSFNSFKDNTAARVAKKDVNKTAKSTAKSIEKNTAKRTTRKPSGKKRKKKIKFKRNKVLAVCRVLIILFVTLAIIGGIAGAGYAAYVISKADTIHPDKIYETLDVSSHIFDQDGELVDEIYFSENRHLVKYEDLPENLKDAIIAFEDMTFW